MSISKKISNFLSQAFDQGVTAAEPLTETQLQSLLAQVSAAGAGHTSASLTQVRNMQRVRQGDVQDSVAKISAPRARKQRQQSRAAKRGHHFDVSSFLPIQRAL